ncbi:HalOD1 output domain-containing protein [Natronolimnohabitans innermongolicus]|uniref:Halobacterial output domain-containing protein n=1 Tax=Natronolimnohabitans innermongolicus JCM 12255 TaxID=1227499 RepID=L9WT54_9EURY|nr:HalOD1 output domain-containing protein [Natronolimnohabitans innermongolicus]ELY52607.1 hypothetical protein C493_16200 [Natronolimnohabitans innermongolicus JCM 12255]
MSRRTDTERRVDTPTIGHVSSHDSVAAAITSAVADARGERREAITLPTDRLDPDALDALFLEQDRSRAAELDLQLTATVAGCSVVLYGDGRVVAVPPSRTERTDRTRDGSRRLDDER